LRAVTSSQAWSAATGRARTGWDAVVALTQPRRRAVTVAVTGFAAVVLLIAGIPGAAGLGSLGIPPTPTRAAPGKVDWLQFAFSPDKRAINPYEKVLNPGNVRQLRPLFNVPLTDAPDGAPVLLTGVGTRLGSRDVVYVKGEHGHLWALDAHTGQQIWLKNLNVSCHGCYDNSAPAIGPDRQYIYAGGADGKIHKLRVGDGTEIFEQDWPQVSSVPMVGGRYKFSMQLAWATARNRHTYLYAGHSVGGSGHFTTVDLGTGTQHGYNNACTESANIHPDLDGTCARTGAHPWSRTAVYDPSLDRVFLDSGSNNNTEFLAGSSWPDTYQALPPDGSTIGRDGYGWPLDSYTPDDYLDNEAHDQDMASGGMQLLPVGVNRKYPHLGVIAGKDHRLKLINLLDMSGQGGPGNLGGELQMLPIEELNTVRSFGAGWTNPADGSAWVYIAGEKGLEAFRLTADADGRPRLERRWLAAHGFTTSPVIAGGMLFAAFGAGERSTIQPFKHIQALDPATGKVLWDAPTLAHHWSSPIVANGIVYLSQGPAGDRQSGTSGVLTAWALPSCPVASVSPAGSSCGNDLSVSADGGDHPATPGSRLTYAIGTRVRSGAPGPVTFSVAGLPADATATFDPPSAPAGQGSTLTVNVPSTARLGSYALVVTATGAGAAPTVATTLNVASNTALVTNLSVKDPRNAGKWTLQHDLEVGNKVYADRATTFKIVFDRVVGTDWISPADDSRTARPNPLVTFTVTTTAEVNVAVDQRAGRPAWIDSSWEDRGTYLVSTDGVTYELFRRTFAAGTVALGPGGGGPDSAQYLIAVQTSAQAAIADTAIDNGYDLSHAGTGGGPANPTPGG
jgi:outer membrane protein assembly factor BamB